MAIIVFLCIGALVWYVYAPAPEMRSTLPNTYTDEAKGFSIEYPQHFTPDTNYSYEELGPGKSIAGVKFTIDPVIAKGTNLSTDSYISVETLPDAHVCSATSFLDDSSAQTVSEGLMNYSVASSTGAGAGNRYEEMVYAIQGSNPCLAVRYFIHWGVLENYPPGVVSAFDHAVLIDAFDAVRRSLTVR